MRIHAFLNQPSFSNMGPEHSNFTELQPSETHEVLEIETDSFVGKVCSTCGSAIVWYNNFSIQTLLIDG